jgi:hypothetical protein
MKTVEQRIIITNRERNNLFTMDDDGFIHLYYDPDADDLIDTLPPFHTNPFNSLGVTWPAAEVQQQVTILCGEEVIVANTKYGIEIGCQGMTYEGAPTGTKAYGYTSPTPLSGDADLDRAQVVNALVSKINADPNNYVRAVACTRIEAVLEAVLPTFAPGDYVFQTDTDFDAATWVARIAWSTPGAEAGDNVVIYVYDETGEIDTSTDQALYVNTTTPAALTTDAVKNEYILSQSIQLIDDANYFPPRPFTRKGANVILKTKGWTAATTVYTGVEAVYCQGITTDMLKRYPVFHYSGLEVTGNAAGTGIGEADWLMNELPSATYYAKLDLGLAKYIQGGPAANPMYEAEYVMYIIYVPVSALGEDEGLAAQVASGLMMIKYGEIGV